MTATDYVLALTTTELTRYRRMAEAARRDEGEMWTRAGIVAGATVADIGCGPGAITVELADIVGPNGVVIAVDQDDSALAAAREAATERGFGDVIFRQAPADATGVEPRTVDSVMIRNVLAHNGGREQSIIDHAASLLPPAGSMFVVDVDLTAQRFFPDDADLADLHQRYVQLHRDRGNDPLIGLRLPELLGRAGLDVAEYRGWYLMVPATPGLRPPAWVARDAIVTDGLATAADIERWSVALDRLDHARTPPTIFVSVFAATGRRRN